MSDNTIKIFPGTGERSPKAMLQAASQQELESVVIIGMLPDTELFISTSLDNCPDMHWLLTSAEYAVMREVWGYG